MFYLYKLGHTFKLFLRLYIYTSVILHSRCIILFYTKLLYSTEFSIRIVQYFVVLCVVQVSVFCPRGNTNE